MRGQSLDSIWRYSEAVDELRKLWQDGLSASSIAAILQRYAPVSRNSVIGKARRMGLPGRPSPITFGAGHPRRGARKQPMTTLAAYLNSPPAVEALPPAVAPARTAPVWQSAEAVPLPVSSTGYGEREGDGRPCQWIHDRDVPKWPGKPRFCGQPVVNESSWCEHHYSRAFIPKAERKVDKGRLERLAAAE